jgi:hypothetical protein
MAKYLWRQKRLAALLLLLAGAVAAVSLPAEAGKPKGEGKELAVLNTKRLPSETARLGEELGIELDSLATLGRRIDASIERHDPVSLAGLARELHAVELVAKKKAKLTASKLTARAVEMARFRNRPNELRVVARLLADKDTGKKLNDQATRTAKALASKGKGDKAKGIQGRLTVFNNTPFDVTMFINHVNRGTIPKGVTASALIGDAPTATTVIEGKALGTAPMVTWGPAYVSEPVMDWKVTLNYKPGGGAPPPPPEKKGFGDK